MSETFGYKLKYDTGFAPNPFHGVLTLATCKPAVRRCRKVGDWVAGFASQDLVNRTRRESGVEIPYRGLVYLMQVGEKLRLEHYFEDARYQVKKPDMQSLHPMLRRGDNIYRMSPDGNLALQDNEYHGKSEVKADVGGVNALVASTFYYFGRKAWVPAGGWATFLGEDVSHGRLFKCPSNFVSKLLGHFATQGVAPGVHGEPCLWKVPSDVSAPAAGPLPRLPLASQIAAATLPGSKPAPSTRSGCGS